MSANIASSPDLTSAEPERWIDVSLLPAEIEALIQHHRAVAAELRATGDRVGARRVEARIAELSLTLALGRAAR